MNIPCLMKCPPHILIRSNTKYKHEIFILLATHILSHNVLSAYIFSCFFSILTLENSKRLKHTIGSVIYLLCILSHLIFLNIVMKKNMFSSQYILSTGCLKARKFRIAQNEKLVTNF